MLFFVSWQPKEKIVIHRCYEGEMGKGRWTLTEVREKRAIQKERREG